MSGVSHIDVKDKDDGIRLDRWFKLYYPDLGHGRLQKLLRKGEVRLDGKKAAHNTRVEQGQTIRVPPLGEPVSSKGQKTPNAQIISKKDASFIRSTVLYKSKDELVINKPAGIAVQGGSKTARHIDGLLDALKFGSEERPRLVHRLDRDTSGVLVLARTRKSASRLTRAFKEQRVDKIYWALVNGVPRPANGRIDMPLIKAGKEGQQRMRAAVRGEKGGQAAVSDFSVVAQAGDRFSWLALKPRTGRTHQLRVHLQEIGHHIFGDKKYNNQLEGVDKAADLTALGSGLHLHAARIRFPSAAGKPVEVSAPLPQHMLKSWAFLSFDQKLDVDPFEELD